MGDISEMIIDGTLAEDGSYQGGHFNGSRAPSNSSLPKVKYPNCRKMVKAQGLSRHIRDKGCAKESK